MDKQMMFLIILAAMMLALTLALPRSIEAAPGGLASGMVRAPAANVEVEILESNSDYVNHIYLVSPGSEIFIGTDEATGTIVALPPVSPGTELVFEIRVFEMDGTDTGFRWKSGPPGRNPDHVRHVQLTQPAPDQILVSFEDLPASAWDAPEEPNFVDAIFVVREAS
jgi:hypothetical protein